MSFTVNFKIPEAGDPFSRWCDKHNVTLSMFCALGHWHVTATRRVVHSYSDARGTHSEEWTVTRVGTDPTTMLAEALLSVAKSSGIESEFTQAVAVTS